MLLVVDVGNTQTHFGTFRGEELIEHWRFATVRESTADELGAALRNLLELRGIGLADLSSSIVSSTVPQLEPEWMSMAQRYLGHRMLAVGPGLRTGMAIRIDNPRELGADRLVNAVAAHALLGRPLHQRGLRDRRQLRRRLGRGRVPRRRDRARRRDLARRAHRARREAARGSTSAAPRSAIGKGTVDAIRSGDRVRLRGAGRRHHHADPRGAGRRTRRRSRPAASRAPSSRRRPRSTRSTTCSR